MKEENTNKKIKELLIKASGVVKKGDLNNLEEILKEIIKLDPNNLPAYYNIGRLAEQSKKFDKAIEFYKNALKINNKHLDSLINLINCYEDIGNLDEAINVSEKTCKLFPEKFETQYNFARLNHKYNRDSDKALSAYEKTLTLKKNFVPAEMGLGQIYKSKGDFSEAKSAFEKVIGLDDNHIKAHYEIVDFLDKKEIEKKVKNLEILEKDKEKKDSEKIYLYFTLGKMFEKLKKFKQSMHYYNLGNKLNRKHIEYSIDSDYEKKRFDEIKNIVKKFSLSGEGKNIGHKTNKPIFIVGMPRSGTTLVEQIVSSHSKIFGGGELTFFSDILKKISGNNSKNLIDVLKKISKQDFSEIGKLYLDEINKISKNSKYFTNKLPLNFINIGLIKCSLPNAKIIHCERNSIDTCFSCYKTLFSEGNKFSYSLEDLGHFYNLYQKQMDYYKESFGKKILHIKYEDVVLDIRNETKKILEYLKLNYEEECLKFYENKRTLKTASLVQARKPIYKSSLNYWKNFENFLGPLTKVLNL